jgi:hypothetical protein
MIGNLVAPLACPRWSPNGIRRASQIAWPIQACGMFGLATATCCALIDSARVAEDRPHFNVQTLRAVNPGLVGQLPVLAGLGQRVPVDAVQLGKGPACAQSRLPAPLTVEDGRSQISGDLRVQRKPRGTSAAAFVPDVPERIGVPSP